MNVKKWLITATLAVGMATGASAATLTGSTSGVFRADNIGGGSYYGTNSCRFNGGGGANSAVAWGDPNSCPDVNDVGQDDSTLSIQRFAFDEDFAAAKQVKIGQIDWDNQANTRAVDFAAIADITLALTSPNLGSSIEGLAFNIRNTSNPSADNILALTFSDFGLNIPFTVGGILFSGFSFTLIDPIEGESLIVSPNSNGVGFTWVNPEGNSSSVAINAHVAPVPLPAAGWLLIAGLGGLGALRRRRKAA